MYTPALKNSRNQKMARVSILLDVLRKVKAENPERFTNPEAIDTFLRAKARAFLLEKRSTDNLVETVKDVLALWPNDWEKKNGFLEKLREQGVQ